MKQMNRFKTYKVIDIYYKHYSKRLNIKYKM